MIPRLYINVKWKNRTITNSHWSKEHTMTLNVRHDVKKGVSWHQIVCHVIKNFHNVHHDVKYVGYVYVSYDVISLLRCHKIVMNDFKKSVYPDFKMFVMMSKYVMRTNGASLLQRVRHDVNKTSSRQKVCHRIKRFVMMSKNMPNVCHEIKNMSWCQKVWMYWLVTYIYTHTLTYNLICYILIKCYIVLQLYRINLRINYNIVIVCNILVQHMSQNI